MSPDRVSWLHDDIKYIRKAIDDIRVSQAAHERNCPALRAYTKKPSNPPPPYILSPWRILVRLAPLVVAAALGLLGLGAYLGAGGTLPVDSIGDKNATPKN